MLWIQGMAQTSKNKNKMYIEKIYKKLFNFKTEKYFLLNFSILEIRSLISGQSVQMQGGV